MILKDKEGKETTDETQAVAAVLSVSELKKLEQTIESMNARVQQEAHSVQSMKKQAFDARYDLEIEQDDDDMFFGVRYLLKGIFALIMVGLKRWHETSKKNREKVS